MMRITRIVLAALLATLFGASAAATAGAQVEDDYPVSTPTSEVLGEGVERDGAAPDDGPAAEGDQAGETEVRSSGASLPVTGGDIVGLVLLGLAAIGLGSLLVHRRRATDA